MASIFAHAALGAALWPVFRTSALPPRAWMAGAVLAAVPDLDVAGFRLGIHYGDLLGHRGLSHSFLFAALLGALVLLLLYPVRRWPDQRIRLWLYLALSTASHGVLDAMTTGGLGVAFFAPLHNERYFFPFRPIKVSPIGIGNFFSGRGLAILLNEAFWVGLPSAFLALVASRLRPLSEISQ